MRVLARLAKISLLLVLILLLTGCAPLPYQGPVDPYTQIIIIHDPGPGPCYPPGPKYPRPQPDPPRKTPLTRDQVTEQREPRTKNPARQPVLVADGTSKRPPRKR